MEKFGHMAAGFSDWKEETGLEINFNDSRGYFWRLGTPAKEFWQPDFENNVPDAKPAEISSFRAMFEEGGELLGIPVAKGLGNFRGIRLYRMSEYNKSYPVSNMLVVFNGVILPSDVSKTVTDTLTGDIFNPPIIIKPETLKMSGRFDGVDVIASKVSGLVYGAGLRNQIRTTNRVNGESIMGTFDYRNGNIQIIRSNDINDRLLPEYEAFIEEYQNLPPGTVIGGTGTDTSGDTSGGAAAPTAPSGRLVSIDFTLSYTVFGNPVSKVWEFMLD